MLNLSQMINDIEAACNCRVMLGLCTEEYGEEGPHPLRTKTCTIIASIQTWRDDPSDPQGRVIGWVEEHAERYGYHYSGSYIGAVIVEPLFQVQKEKVKRIVALAEKQFEDADYADMAYDAVRQDIHCKESEVANKLAMAYAFP